MKNYTLFRPSFAALFSLFVLGTASAQQQYTGTVTHISDGDTIRFKPTNSAEMKVRMVGMDTPELHLSVPSGVVAQLPWGKDAGLFLQRLIPVGSKVTLQTFGVDAHKRVLGRVLSQGRDTNLRLVEVGHAIPYMICTGETCDSNFYERFQVVKYFQACDRARSARLGIFNPVNPMREMPFEFRLRMQNRKPDKYVGDVSTKKLYSPAQYKKVDLCRRIFFVDPKTAATLGYRPAF